MDGRGAHNPRRRGFRPNRGAGSASSNTRTNNFNTGNNANANYNPYNSAFTLRGAGASSSNTRTNNFNTGNNTNANYNPFGHPFASDGAGPSSSNTRSNRFNSGNNANANFNSYNERLRASRPNRFQNNPNGENTRWREEENRVPPESFQDNHERREKKRGYIMGFKKLLELSENESSEMIIMELKAKTDVFETLLDSDLQQNWIVLIIKILSKVFSSSFVENKLTIMSVVLKQKFMTTLEKYVVMLQYEEPEKRRNNNYFWGNVEEFYFNLAIMCETSIDAVPTRACEVLPKLLKIVVDTMPNFEQQQKIHLSDTTKDKFKNAIVKLELCKEELEQKKLEVKRDREEAPPPDDFRTLSIYPTCDEILSQNPPFFRKNIIEGKYRDVEHYLDVQFRLLKEDFVAPLRQGIAEYFELLAQGVKRMKKISNVQIHKEVVLTSPCFVNDQVGVNLKFKARDTSRLFHPNSKRFMHGSLVCFTKDNFATVLFGKILEKDVKLNQLVIGFDLEYNNYVLNVPYLMVECKIYFEPYYHVLKALQSIDEDGFPMKSYLIDVNNTLEPPGYLHLPSAYTIQNRRVYLFADNTWPSAEELQLNPTQYIAFKASLTQKFAVIQGPPGTGKTYLGLEIVKTLLDERNIANWYNRTPILVVCFTNHALDQFLEGLIGTTERIIRVGGQSKNELLQEFQLINKRKSKNDRMFGEALRTCRQELGQLLRDIKRHSEIITEIEQFNSIIKFNSFDVIDEEIPTSWFSQASKKDLVEWLFGGQENRNVIFNTLSELPAPADRETDEEEDENEDMEENNRDVALDDAFEILSDYEEKSLLSAPFLSSRIVGAQRAFAEMDNEHNISGNYERQLGTQKFLADLTQMLEYLVDKLQNAKNALPPSKPRDVNYRYPNFMQPADRWQLYFYWVHSYKKYLVDNLVNLQQQHHQVHKQYTEIRNINDTELMKDMLVVGMTTTGAARLQTTLQALKCRIVVVEEAAEVLESHVTVSLTNHCQHLILIGDHQQLRPSTADYRIEKKFNLGISMFERMVLNKIQCNVLGVQHRMHPKIASLIVPHIYPKLDNHPSVENYPPILGIDHRLYFIHHTNPEIQSGDESKANMHEAKFLINLARYLIQNGYKPQDVTILAAYSGQMFTLREERKKSPLLLQDVRICVLDNYQGEESKIILLSLVRNNVDNSIGFLKIENRVCVALSRAKEGFYMMGNMDLLCNNSEIWPKIKETLVDQGSLGPSLAVRCQIHSDRVTHIVKPQDFDKVPEGGCNQICGSLLNCGHNCSRLCHILDRVHSTTKCKAPCSKILCEFGHICPKFCYEECGNCMFKVPRILGCGHEHVLDCYLDPKDFKCPTLVKATLPCGHQTTKKPCHYNVNEWRCSVKCDSRVEPCGHSCTRFCHIEDDPEHIKYKCYKTCENVLQGCSTETHKCPRLCHQECPSCEVIVKKKLPNCNHMHDVPCSAGVDNIECIKPCRRIIATCGHHCKRKCYQPCGGCVIMVPKPIQSCGHQVQTRCSEPADIRNCRGACTKVLPCGHLCKKKCNEVCTTQCRELVDHTKQAFCGHKFKIECHLNTKDFPNYSPNLLQFCREPCTAVLDCEHNCGGTCGECAQGRIHKTCMEKCGVPLICGHECKVPCRTVCQPCQLKCGLKCSHSKCTKKCGDECTKCNESCARQCKHVKCTSKCWDMCTVPPCQEPCEKILPCSHPCVGFCGDPCPPLCRICDAEELTEIFLGFEDEIDARFVLLDECKHVIESQGMEIFFENDGGGANAITYRRCPKCRTPLTSTQRYSDYVKQAIKDVVAIKRKFGGSPKEIEEKRKKLQEQLHAINLIREGRVFSTSQGFHKFVTDCGTLLQVVNKNKRQRFDLMIGKTLEAKLTIVQSIGNILQAQKLNVPRNSVPIMSGAHHLQIFSEATTYLEYLLKRLTEQVERITDQEIQDFKRERDRMQRIAQFVYIVEHSPKPDDHIQIRELIYRPIIYTQQYDKMVKAELEAFIKKMRVGIGLTDQERIQIVRATGLSLGHWYKCPNGHIYAIGECGGAAQIGKCNECGAQIGGTDHNLLASNAHAGEMDGSTHAAWSNAANMLNYRLHDLR